MSDYSQWLMEGTKGGGCSVPPTQQLLSWPEYHRAVGQLAGQWQYLQLRSLTKLMVEVSYVFYLRQGETLWLSKVAFLPQGSQQEHRAFRLLLSDQSLKALPARQKQMAQQVCVQVRAGVGELLNELKMLVGVYVQARKQQKILGSRSNEAVIRGELQEFIYVVWQVITPKAATIPSLQKLLMMLEETRLFRQNSLLLRYSNNTLLGKIEPYPELHPRHAPSQTDEMVAFAEWLVQLCRQRVVFCNVSQGEQATRNLSRMRPTPQLFYVEEAAYQFLTPQKVGEIVKMGQEPEVKANGKAEGGTGGMAGARKHQLSVSWVGVREGEVAVELRVMLGKGSDPDIWIRVLSGMQGRGVVGRIEERPLEGQRLMILAMTVAYHSQQDMLLGVMGAVDQLIIHNLVFEPYLREQTSPDAREVGQIGEKLEFLLGQHSGLLVQYQSAPDL